MTYPASFCALFTYGKSPGVLAFLWHEAIFTAYGNGSLSRPSLTIRLSAARIRPMRYLCRNALLTKDPQTMQEQSAFERCRVISAH
jgi:hypothetical protein